jgi:hypothetical protein
LSLDTEISSVRRRSAPRSRDLVDAVTRLAARYHDEKAPEGRAFRVVVVAHPLPHAEGREKPS